MANERVGSVLIIDNDRDIAELARAVLTDSGYQVAVLADISPEAIAAAVGRLEPDVVLLDGQGPAAGYASSWHEAAVLAARRRRVPVVMFTAHGGDLREAQDAASERSREAMFAAILAKPFDIDELLDAVAKAAGKSVPFDRSAAADQSRTKALADAITKVGGRDVRMSARREWVTFETPGGRFMQVYWWQVGGSYLIGRYDRDGRRMENIALTYDRDAAVEICAAAIRVEAGPSI